MIQKLNNKIWVWWHYGRHHTRDNFCLWLAMHLPKRLAYWTYIRVHAQATAGTYSDKQPGEITYDMALKDWNLSG